MAVDSSRLMISSFFLPRDHWLLTTTKQSLITFPITPVKFLLRAALPLGATMKAEKVQQKEKSTARLLERRYDGKWYVFPIGGVQRRTVANDCLRSPIFIDVRLNFTGAV